MSNPIGRQDKDTLKSLFGRDKPVIGVVHLMPLPGAMAHQ